MNIGVTGFRGTLGGAVFRFLAAKGHKVISLDDFTRLRGVEELNEKEFPAELDWVLHFGAKTSIQESFASPFTTYSTNINSTLIALSIAATRKASFLFMSSYVYGEPRYLPIDEMHSLDGMNPYMGSKIVCERLCEQLGQNLGIPLIILRGFNIYGNDRIPGRLISDLLEAVRTGSPLSINDPNPIRDYLYIRDFEELVLKIISQSPPKRGTYNVAHGTSYSNLEVAEIFREITGSKEPVQCRTSPRKNDISDCSADPRLLQKSFDWQPRYSLEDGLRELIYDAPLPNPTISDEDSISLRR